MFKRKVMKLPRALLFDLDGTLIEFEREFLFTETERIIELMQHRPVARTEMERSFAEFDFYRVLDGVGEERDEFLRRFFQHYRWHEQPKARILEGVPELLADLRSADIEVAIVTARLVDPEVLRKELNDIGLGKFISHVMSRADESHEWKDKRPTILRACSAIGCKPQETVMVGDIPHDVTSAQAVGVGTTVAVLSGGIEAEVLRRANPDHLLSSVKELYQILPALSRSA